MRLHCARLGSKVAAEVTKALQMNWKRSMGSSCVDFVTQNFSTTSQVRQMLANMEEWSSGAEVSKCFRDFTGSTEISKGQLLQVLNKILPGADRRGMAVCQQMLESSGALRGEALDPPYFLWKVMARACHILCLSW
eukprot:Skav202730  [mRNA]  locus=scaffold1326:164261:165050:- [translate_table: standard]